MSAALVFVGTTGCTATTQPIPLKASPTPPASRVQDLRLPAGSKILVVSAGATYHGRVLNTTPTELELEASTPHVGRVRLELDSVDMIAMIVGRSKEARGWIGAAI